jgi:hypothetical protein
VLESKHPVRRRIEKRELRQKRRRHRVRVAGWPYRIRAGGPDPATSGVKRARGTRVSGNGDNDIELVEMPFPTALDEGRRSGFGPSDLSPDKHLTLYNDVQWEEFVREWATTLSPKYEQVMRNGGANDHGVDVAGFLSDQGFDGAWDCFQCKNYGKALLLLPAASVDHGSVTVGEDVLS